MVTVIQSNGTIVKTQPDRVYQGSNKVNQIVLVGAFSQNLIPQIAFKLPQTETFTTFDYMTSANIPTGTGLSGWTYDIPVAVTQYYGQVEFQIQVTDINGNIVASGLCSFEVERGVPPDTSSIPDIDPYNTIIQIIQSIQGDIENGFLMSKGLLPYDLTFEYPLNAVVFDPNTKDMFVSLQANNVGNALSDSSYWESLKTYTGLQEQITTNAQAIQTNSQNIASNTQLIEQLQEEFANFESFEIQIVQELPTTGKSNVMYLVPIAGQDAYEEYVWLSEEQRFELIGTTQVDLSDYYTKEQTNNLLSNKADLFDLLNVEATVGEHSTQIEDLQSSVETLNTNLSSAENNITNLQSEVATNTSNIGTNTQNIENINTTLNTKADSSTVNALQGQLNNLEENVVLITPQTLTEEQQAQVRENIGAGASGFSGSYNDLSNLPVLNTENTTSQIPNTNETITGTINLHKISKTGDFTDLTNVTQASTAQAGVIEIATDSEASAGTSETLAVTPKQLQNAIAGIGTVFNLKGSVTNVSDLPSTGNTIGDVWYVTSESVGYIWLNDGTEDRWEQLGLPVDLSNYVEISSIVNNLTSTAVDQPLSAYQGNVLNSNITNITNDLSGKANLSGGNTFNGQQTFNNSVQFKDTVGILGNNTLLNFIPSVGNAQYMYLDISTNRFNFSADANFGSNTISEMANNISNLLSRLYITSAPLAVNNDIVLSNGLIIKVGYYTGSSGGNFTITFNTPFPNDCFCFIHSQRAKTSADFDKTTITGLTSTGASMESSSYEMNYYYIAVGY